MKTITAKLLLIVVGLAVAMPAAADWTASGVVQYRDRDFDGSGFTGLEPALPVRFADVEVLDSSGPSVLATGVTDGSGAFSIVVPDSQIRDVYVRVLTRSDETPDLHLEVTTAAFDPYAVATPDVIAHDPATDADFGVLVAEIGLGGEPFNMYDMGLYGSDFFAYLTGSRPGNSTSLSIVWEADRGQSASTASFTRLDIRDTSGYDDTVDAPRVRLTSSSSTTLTATIPAAPTASAQCDQDPDAVLGRRPRQLSSAARSGGTSDLPRPHIYVRTTGEPGPGPRLALRRPGNRDRVRVQRQAPARSAVFTALWDIVDGPADNDFTPGSRRRHRSTCSTSTTPNTGTMMANGLPGRASDYRRGLLGRLVRIARAQRQLAGDDVDFRRWCRDRVF